MLAELSDLDLPIIQIDGIYINEDLMLLAGGGNGICFPVKCDESVSPNKLRFGVSPIVNLAPLNDNPKFKRPV